MASPQPPSAIERGEDYETLLSIALEQKPDFDLDPTTFAIAMLAHDKDVTNCHSSDFVWLKVKARHSVSKLKLHYQKKHGISVEIRLGNYAPSDATHIRHLVASNAEYPILTTLPVSPQVGGNQATTSNTTSSSNRSPLHNTDSQLSASPAPMRDVKPIIKPEPGRAATPTTQLSQVPVATPCRVKNEQPASPGLMSPSLPTRSRDVDVKPEPKQEEKPMPELDLQAVKKAQSARLLKLMDDGTPDQLEAEVRDMQILLEALKTPMVATASEQQDAKHWVQQIDNLLKHKVDTPTVIGVVGNTGAGKSSVINAMLEEERLVPTNCMRACTAVVTEMSYNTSEKPSAKYRAQIEFIKAADWEKDLKLSFSELLDGNGQVSRECTNEESEAGVAYAKLKSVYPSKTKEMLAQSSVESLLNDPAVKKVLGTTMTIERPKADSFYKALQNVIDSKEKKKGEKKEMEFWPLIKVVKLYTKADALSTGAIIVDLPGVHDSNAARAAVAAGYMKQCTGLFIVAPINRAVDDKAAKSLLGESFKRQLKFDGSYSRITFLCSKTDDISITEASDSLGYEEKMATDWNRIDEIDKKVRELKERIKEMKDSKQVYLDVSTDLEEQVEIWEDLKDKVEDGKKVWAPDTSKKRKRSPQAAKSRKKSKMTIDLDDDDDIIDDDDEASGTDEDGEDKGDEEENREPLTMELVEEKIAKFKEDKKRARTERTEIDGKMKPLKEEVETLEKKKEDIEAAMSAICIAGRNDYSRGAIQRDFADGIRELDMENAQEEDPNAFDPEDQIRDYDEVARSLPVFCVSARAYQKLSGRLQRDANVSGFRTVEETEIPQLQAHCKKLTEGGRAANCRAFLINFSQLLNSLSLWSSNDGSGVNLSDAQLALETRFLKTRLLALEKSLQESVKSSLTEIGGALAEHLYENYDDAVELAKEEAPDTCRKWHRKPNRADRAAGGYYWATYKALCRREGVFSNGQGPHDLNAQLTAPIIKTLGNHWERVFIQKLPRVLQAFSRQSKNQLHAFHKEIETRSTKLGHGMAGLGLLGENLRNYEGIFSTLAAQMVEMINALQRDANREFTPVITRRLQNSYAYCSAETGAGQYNRMKAHMESHIDQAREIMFRESVNEVKKLLDDMCEEVQETMLARSDDVYTMMSRDYLSVMGGSQLPDGGVMPRWERKMRAEVREMIENRDDIVSQNKKAAQDDKEAEAKRVAEKERIEAERVAAAEKREKDEAKARKKRKADEEKEVNNKAEEEKVAKAPEDSLNEDAAVDSLKASKTGRESAAIVESPRTNAEDDDAIMELS